MLIWRFSIAEKFTGAILFKPYYIGIHENRRKRGEGKPESFNFLGFTHLCGQKRNGKFVVLRHTMRKRLRSKCRQLKQELRRRMHQPIPVVGRWLRSVLRGHYNYYGVPRNGRAIFCQPDSWKNVTIYKNFSACCTVKMSKLWKLIVKFSQTVKN